MIRRHARAVVLTCTCGGFVRIDTDAYVGQSHSRGCTLAPMPPVAQLAIVDRKRPPAEPEPVGLQAITSAGES